MISSSWFSIQVSLMAPCTYLEFCSIYHRPFSWRLKNFITPIIENNNLGDDKENFCIHLMEGNLCYIWYIIISSILLLFLFFILWFKTRRRKIFLPGVYWKTIWKPRTYTGNFCSSSLLHYDYDWLILLKSWVALDSGKCQAGGKQWGIVVLPLHYLLWLEVY